MAQMINYFDCKYITGEPHPGVSSAIDMSYTHCFITVTYKSVAMPASERVEVNELQVNRTYVYTWYVHSIKK